MKKYIRWTAGVLLLAAGTFLLLSAVPQQDLDPLKVASDSHKLLFENKVVRVIEAKVPPGKTEPKHSHPQSVTVYLANYTVETTTFPGGKVTRGDRKFGSVAWTDATVHEIKNVGNTPSHAIRVELKY